MTGPQGEQGPQGIQGIQGIPGDDGLGVPAGGTTGQVLSKASNADNDTVWADGSGGGSPPNLTLTTLTLGNYRLNFNTGNDTLEILREP